MAPRTKHDHFANFASSNGIVNAFIYYRNNAPVFIGAGVELFKYKKHYVWLVRTKHDFRTRPSSTKNNKIIINETKM